VSFLVEPQKQGRQFVSGLASKPLEQFLIGLGLKTDGDSLLVVWLQNHWNNFSSVWALKPIATICEWFGLKTTRTVFTGLTSKPVATVSSSLTLKPAVTGFSSLTSKLMVTVSPGLTSKRAVDFLVEPQKQGGGGFSGLDFKIGSFGLVIWASKSPRRFLGLRLKTKWTSVYQLRHKTDGGRSAWDTRRDLATCFTWKQVWLGFSSLT
jgi:hypothetical protein